MQQSSKISLTPGLLLFALLGCGAPSHQPPTAATNNSVQVTAKQSPPAWLKQPHTHMLLGWDGSRTTKLPCSTTATTGAILVAAKLAAIELLSCACMLSHEHCNLDTPALTVLACLSRSTATSERERERAALMLRLHA